MERTPRSLGLPSDLEAAGFNVAGALASSTYDRLVPEDWSCAALLPEARRVLVLACGGRRLGQCVLQASAAGSEADPVDRHTERVVGALAAALEERGARAVALYATERRGGTHADFVGLARAAGLGAPSRLGLLLHPRYGPWLSIRAVVLTSRHGSTTGALEGFDPCSGCPAPCQVACPVDAPERNGFDVDACAGFRRAHRTCRSSCAARRACPIGEVHAYAPRLERLHMAASARWLGIADETADPPAAS